MNKQEFVERLRSKLSDLAEKDIEERVEFFVEMINERIEDGASEEEAVSAIGSVEDIAAQIIAEVMMTKIAKEKIKPKKKLKIVEILLLAIGSPIWISLLIAAISVIISLYVSLWAVIVSVWAAFVSTVAASIGCIVFGVTTIIYSSLPLGLALIGASLFCLGLSIFIFLGSKALTKVVILGTKKMALGIKKFLLSKEQVK